MAYLTLAEFKLQTIAPAAYVDAIEAAEAGWTAGQLDYWSKWIDSRLAKRYSVPFGSPYPVAVQGWLARLVTLRVYYKRGIDPTDAQWDAVRQDATDAMSELKEAADSHEGLFELPLKANDDTTAITRGDPLAYTEASPYKWADEQRDTARDEDYT